MRDRNDEGENIVDTAITFVLHIVNTFFENKVDQFVTYNSGGRASQIDFLMCRRCHLKVVIHCKMVNGEAVAGQRRVLVKDWMKIILKYNSESGKHHEDKRTT